tara:strand:- start:2910 stop:3083 length:174 start_codon:yes stop_codon:yes gene_type:complete
MKIPRIGQRIIHEEPDFDRVTEGYVVDLLSIQFTYETYAGKIKSCFYKDNWKVIDKD